MNGIHGEDQVRQRLVYEKFIFESMAQGLNLCMQPDSSGSSGNKVDDPSQSARAFYVSSSEPKD